MDFKILLNKIKFEKENRSKLIRNFQDLIWGSSDITDPELLEIYSELAHDLNYYVSNEKMRQEDFSYYGEDNLVKEINETLEKLEKIKNSKE